MRALRHRRPRPECRVLLRISTQSPPRQLSDNVTTNYPLDQDVTGGAVAGTSAFSCTSLFQLRSQESSQALAGAAWLVMPRRAGRVMHSKATAARARPAPTNSWPNPTYLSSTPAAEAATGDRPMKVNSNRLMVRPI